MFVRIRFAREGGSLSLSMHCLICHTGVVNFIVSDYMDRAGEFYRDMGGWLKDGKLKRNETVFDGLESTPDAFLGLFSGGNTGKMLVRI